MQFQISNLKPETCNLKLHLCLFPLIFLLLALHACGRKEEAPAQPANQGRPVPIKRITPRIAGAPALAEDAPRLAIVIDDLGRDRAAAERLLAFDVPLTFSVLPSLPFSYETAAWSHQRGQEVLLHLPMAANGARQPVAAEPVELRTGMSPQEVRRAVLAMLETVPYATGVNNHQGSRATQDGALMAAVMETLRERGLFFLDSRTSSASVAYDVAADAGLRAAYRTEFLDDTTERVAIEQQLRLAVRRARVQGWAIAIAHPHAATLGVLEEMLPQMHARGIRLVFVSQIAK